MKEQQVRKTYLYSNPHGGLPDKVIVRRTKYKNGRLALQLMSQMEDMPEGYFQPFLTCSINLPDHDCPDGEVWIKNWAENVGCLDFLIANHIVEGEATAMIQTGMVVATRHKVVE